MGTTSTAVPALAFVLIPAAWVATAVFSELMAALRIKTLSRRGRLDAATFIYPFWNRLKPELAFGSAHELIADKALSRYIYVYRSAFYSLVFVSVLVAGAIAVDAIVHRHIP